MRLREYSHKLCNQLREELTSKATSMPLWSLRRTLKQTPFMRDLQDDVIEDVDRHLT